MNRHERRAAAAARATREAKASPDKRLRGMEIRHGGRTLDVRVFVNTEEEATVVAERVRIAAQGPDKKMVVVMAGELDPEDALAVWEQVFPAAVESAKRQN